MLRRILDAQRGADSQCRAMTRPRLAQPRPHEHRLKIRIPMAFEAVAEGRLAVILLVLLIAGAGAVLFS